MDVLRILYEAKSDTPLEDKAYQKALEQTCQAERELLEAFPEARELLSALQSAQLNLFSHTAYHEFSEGFCVKVKNGEFSAYQTERQWALRGYLPTAGHRV